MWKLLYASVASLPSDSLMIEPPGWRFIKSLTSYTRPRMIISLLVSIEETVRSAASVRTMLGDSMMATDRKEMAKRLWIPAARSQMCGNSSSAVHV